MWMRWDKYILSVDATVHPPRSCSSIFLLLLLILLLLLLLLSNFRAWQILCLSCSTTTTAPKNLDRWLASSDTKSVNIRTWGRWDDGCPFCGTRCMRWFTSIQDSGHQDHIFARLPVWWNWKKPPSSRHRAGPQASECAKRNEKCTLAARVKKQHAFY